MKSYKNNGNNLHSVNTWLRVEKIFPSFLSARKNIFKNGTIIGYGFRVRIWKRM